MSLSDSFIKGTPFPELPGDKSFGERSRGSSSDVARATREVMDYLRRFREVDKVIGSERMTILARNIRPARTSILFGMLRNGSTVTVNRGIVLTTKWPDDLTGDTMPEPETKCHRVNVAETEVTISPGQFIYLKLTYETRTANPKGTLSDGTAYAGGTVRGGVGGAGGDGGYGGDGGDGGAGGGGGGGGGAAGAGGGGGGGGVTAGADGAGGNAGSAGVAGTDGDLVGGGAVAMGGDVGQGGVGGGSGSKGFGGVGGNAGSGIAAGGDGGDAGDGNIGGYGGNGGKGTDGEAGFAPDTGGAAPAYGVSGGPTETTIPAFTAYSKARLEWKAFECTSGEIVCEAETDADGYIPLAEIVGTAEAPEIDLWHPGGAITAPQPQNVNVSP